MVGKLTLDILDKTIKGIEAFEEDNEVIGFVVNPRDFEELEAGNLMIAGIFNKSLVMIPPYRGLRLEKDVNQPRGYFKPIRGI